MTKRSGPVVCLLLLVASAAPAVAQSPQLSLPVACDPGVTCFIQQHVDLDPGPGARDYACGGATYDTHSGVDFRLLSAAVVNNKIAVLAAADGVVKGVRDGVRDIFVRDGGKDAVANRECGNGIVLEHPGGWETQYCHLRQGSVAVAKGQAITRGTRLGDVGFSGMADFAHVHVSVRHNGAIIDPFTGASPGAACAVAPDTSKGLWDAATAAKLPYKDGEIIGAGFVSEPPDFNALEVDHTKVAPLAPSSSKLLFYARTMNLRGGDVLRLTVRGPGGFAVNAPETPIDQHKATYLSFAGQRLKGERWASGRYTGRVELVRNGRVIETRIERFEMPP